MSDMCMYYLTAEEIFVIRIYSDEENIIGIYAGCGDMMVKDIDISGCQTLKYFNASFWVDYFDLRTNPGITKVDITGGSCGIADTLSVERIYL